MRTLTDKEIELATAQAAETTRLAGLHEQARRDLEAKQSAEVAALRKELGVDSETPPSIVTEVEKVIDVVVSKLGPFLPIIMKFLGDALEPSVAGYPFNGPVPTPPKDSPPGVPVQMSRVVELPMTGGTIPPMTPAPTVSRAPLPGTGTHPGCTADKPCEKHGGATAGVPSVPIAAEPAHYDGRPLDPNEKGVSCTIFKPCQGCVDRSRRGPLPTATQVKV